jgi:hypothetical protein
VPEPDLGIIETIIAAVFADIPTFESGGVVTVPTIEPTILGNKILINVTVQKVLPAPTTGIVEPPLPTTEAKTEHVE